MQKHLRILMPHSLLLVHIALGGCSNAGTQLASAPYTLQVVSLIPPSNPANPATFEIANKTLSTLQDIDTLDGSFAKMYFGGVLKAHSVLGSLVSSGHFESGETPKLRYHVSDNVAVPNDYLTLAMFSAYYQFDQIASRIATLYGLQPTALASAQKNGKYEVLFEPSMQIESQTISGSIASKRNAAFVPGQGQFVLFERSLAEKVPLATNLQVLAHEFGHAVFDYTFYDNAYSDSILYAGNFIISGINEGFADFTSFLWSGSADVLSGSLAGISAVTERNFITSTYTLLTAPANCTGGFYCIGTLFARSLWQASVDSPTDAQALAQSLPAALRAVRSALDASKITVDPNSSQTTLITQSDFVVLKTFLASLAGSIGTLTPSLTAPLCTRFANNFSLQNDVSWNCPL